nr:rod shape-determining protein [Dactylococcopsis salina]
MSFWNRLSFSRNMGVDLGTANTLVYVSGKGIVLKEPSVVAIDQDNKEALAFGEDAKQMLGRTPGSIVASRPLRDGVIADFDSAELMLQHFIKRAHGGRTLVSPRIVIGIPSGVTGVEKRAVMEAALQAGARDVFLIDEPVAAAIGAGLSVAEPTGNMIIDIGGGTTEVAVLSLQGTVLSESVRVAGDELSDSITQYMKKVHNLVIGERTAEEIKIRVSSAYPTEGDDDLSMEVRGLHLLSGLPRMVAIKAPEIRESMSEPLSVIVEAVKRTLERTPPELASDIINQGIMLAGGGALLRGLDTLITHETGIVTHVAPDPLQCVVLGTGNVLENFKQLGRVFTGSSSS